MNYTTSCWVRFFSRDDFTYDFFCLSFWDLMSLLFKWPTVFRQVNEGYVSTVCILFGQIFFCSFLMKMYSSPTTKLLLPINALHRPKFAMTVLFTSLVIFLCSSHLMRFQTRHFLPCRVYFSVFGLLYPHFMSSKLTIYLSFWRSRPEVFTRQILRSPFHNGLKFRLRLPTRKRQLRLRMFRDCFIRCHGVVFLSVIS